MNHLSFSLNKFLYERNQSSILILRRKHVFMNLKNKSTKLLGTCILASISMLLSFSLKAQVKDTAIPKDTLIKAGREIMNANPYCALVTVDSKGQPQVRTMNPFPLGDEMLIWFATSRKSRKVAEIKNNPKVSVYYADHNHAKGYVTITGKAVIIDDKELLKKMKRDYWESIPDWENIFVLIKIIPVKMDVINYQRGINGADETSRSPSVEF
jgi:general stress protein 26